MLEHDRRRSIEDFLTEEYRKRRILATDQETLRQSFQTEADKKIIQYQKRWKELETEAQVRFTDTVKPWWQDFRERLYDDLIEWHRTSNTSFVILSDEIVYPWPRTILKQQSSLEPFDDAAGSILEAINTKNHSEAARLDTLYMPENELWRARLLLTAAKWSSGEEGVFISRWPPKDGNYEFVESLALKPREEDRWFSKIHPKVWLGFAEQIESGRAWEVLQKSLNT